MSEPISLWVPTAILAAIALPLALKLVPPNRIYGFRTARSLADRELWFRVNQFAGWMVLAATVLSGAIYLAVPELASGRSFPGMLVLVVPLIVVLPIVRASARSAPRARRNG